MSEVEEPGVRDKPLVMWENRRDRGREHLNQVRKECWNRENWTTFLHGHPFEWEKHQKYRKMDRKPKIPFLSII